MGFESIFKSASATVTTLFGKEKGPCTYRQRISSSSYNATTGTTSAEYNDFTDVYMAFDELDDKEVPDLSNRALHKKFLISGNLLSVVPQKHDMIVDSNDIKFLVSRVTTDMYNALFTVYVKEINED